MLTDLDCKKIQVKALEEKTEQQAALISYQKGVIAGLEFRLATMEEPENGNTK